MEMSKYTTVSPFICDNLIQMESDNSLAYINLKGEYVYGFDLKMHTVGGGLAAARGSGLFDCAAAVKVPQDGSSYPTQYVILCQKGRMWQLNHLII